MALIIPDSTAGRDLALLTSSRAKSHAQVRWRSFNILLVQAAVALIMLHTAVNDLLPALPGSELKHAPKPPPIDASRCVPSLGTTWQVTSASHV